MEITKVYYKELRSLKVDGQGGWRNIEIGAEVEINPIVNRDDPDRALGIAKDYVRSKLDKEVEGEEPKTAKDKLIKIRRDVKKVIEGLDNPL